MSLAAWFVLGVTGLFTSFVMIGLLVCAVVRQRCHRQPQPMTSSASLTTDLDDEKGSVSDSDVGSCSPVQDIAVSQSTPDLSGHDGGRYLATGGAPDAKSEGRIGSGARSPVIKQHTLPTMPQRHLWLHRLLFFLDIGNKDDHPHPHPQQQQQQQQERGTKTPVLTGTTLQLPPTALHTGLVQPKPLSRVVNTEASATAEHLQSQLEPDTLQCGRLYIGLTVSCPRPDTEPQSTTLAVRVLRAENLPPREFSGTCDPYVKVHLLPDGNAVYQTKLQRRTLAPIYDESFELKLSPLTSEHQLHFGVFDFDRYSRHDLIGEATLQPHSPGVASERLHVLELVVEKQSGSELGQLLLSLRYLPTAGRLTVTVLKARHLRATDVTSNADPFVKVTMTCGGQKISKKKTSVKYGTSSPVFNEAMTFDVPQHIIEEVSLVVNVFHHSSCGGADLMGVCVVGRQYGGLSRDHWFSMLDRPRKAVAQWHPLSDHVPLVSCTASTTTGLGTNNSSQPSVDTPSTPTR